MVNEAANPVVYLSAKQPLQVFCTNLHQVTKVYPKQHQLTDWICVNTKTISKPRHHYMYVVAHDMPYMTRWLHQDYTMCKKNQSNKIQGNGNLGMLACHQATSDYDKLSASYQHWAIKLCAYQFLILPNWLHQQDQVRHVTRLQMPTATISMCYNENESKKCKITLGLATECKLLACSTMQNQRIPYLLLEHWPNWS